MILFKIALILHFYHGMTSARTTPTIDETIQAANGKSGETDGSIIELDMRLTKEQWEALHGRQSAKEKAHQISKRKALNFSLFRWTNNTVPYRIHTEFSKEDIKVINSSMKQWSKFSCIKFRPSTIHDKNWVHIMPKKGCLSNVGMIGGRQTISLESHCRTLRAVTHELGHTLGFYHEHSRPDRDEYIRILTDNIKPEDLNQFEKTFWIMVNTYGMPYDYESIMHYGGYLYGGKMAIQTIDPTKQNKLGSGRISFYDIKLLNIMYSCGGRCITKKCPGEGFFGKDCRCWCKGPNLQTPVIDCFTKLPIDVRPRPTKTHKLTPAVITQRDRHPSCHKWALTKQCLLNPEWITKFCQYSCSTVTHFTYRRCHTFKCPNKGFVGEDCMCFCEGPNERTPVIDCSSKEPIGVLPDIPNDPRLNKLPYGHMLSNARCNTFKCPNKGFVIEDCRCLCWFPDERTPVIDCFTKEPIDVFPRFPNDPMIFAYLHILLNGRCNTFKCPNVGVAVEDCRCLCKGPNERAPVIDCTTKESIAMLPGFPNDPRLIWLTYGHMFSSDNSTARWSGA